MKKNISILLIISLLIVYLLPLTAYASPLNDDGDDVSDYPISVSGDDIEELYKAMDASDAVWNDYMFSLGRDANQLFTWLGDNPDTVLMSIINDWVPGEIIEQLPNGWQEYIESKSISISDLEADPTLLDNKVDYLNDYFKFYYDKNNQLVAEIKDNNKVMMQSISNAIIQTQESSMLLYQTYSLEEIDKFLLWDEYENLSGSYVPMSKNGIIDMVTSTFTESDYPLLYQRWTSSSSFVSLSNVANDYDIDGFICSSHWDVFSQFFSTFQNNGYVNAYNGREITPIFTLFSNGRSFTNIHDFKRIDKRNLSNPFSVPAYSYSEWRPNVAIRGQSCIISNDGAPIIFFKDTESYLNFYSNKYVIPYDFNGSNIDYTDFFNNLDKSALEVAHSIQDIYALLNDAVVNGLQDAVDRITTTNQWLKKIYNDLHDFKKEWNLRNLFSTLTDIVGVVDDLLDINRELMRIMDNTINNQVIDDTLGFIENTTLMGTIKSRFPFCIPIALVGTIDYISSFEPKPIEFTVRTDAFQVPIEFTFSYEDIPSHETITLIVKSFVFIIFGFGMFKLTLKIIGSYGGGDK